MFRIDRSLVNLSGENGANNDGEAGVSGSINPNTPASPARARVLADEILRNAETEAAEILDAAKAEAEALLSDAESQSEQERERARKLGYHEGSIEARAEYEELMHKDDAMLQSVLKEIQSERERMFAGFEDELTALAIDIARKIIGNALKNDDTVFESIIKTALRQIEIDGKLTIRVGQTQYERFFESGSAVFELSDGVSLTATVMKDAILPSGGLIIDTDESTIDAGVDTQLRLVELAFKKEKEDN